MPPRTRTSRPAKSTQGARRKVERPPAQASGATAGDAAQPGKSAARSARRDAILSAALQVFAEHGFEAARLDEVATRAGVAKGTLYLYFRDKTALFEDLVRSAVLPLIAHLEGLADVPDVPTRRLLEQLASTFVAQVLGTERKLVLRLVIAEGPRFPAIAHFYYEEVVSRGLAMLARVLERGVQRGEIAPAAVARFPQLVMAPLLVSVIWDGLFQKLAPLDVPAMLATHLDTLMPADRPPSTRKPATRRTAK